MKLFVLMWALSASDADCEFATPFWSLETIEDCQTVADTLNRNSDTDYFYCVATEDLAA